MKWLSDFLRDKDKITNTISGVIFAVPFLILLFYWGVLDNIQLSGSLDVKTLGFVAVVFLLSGDQVKIDWRKRSKKDFEETDIEHKATIKKCDDIKFTDVDYDLGKQYENKLNKETQHKYNVKYTDTIIAKIDRQINKLIRKGATVEEVEVYRKQKRQLEKTPLSPNWWNYRYRFTPFDYYEIVSSYDNMSSNNNIEDGSSIKTNAINRNRGLSFIFGIIRSTVLAAAGLQVLFTVPFGQALTISAVLGITLTVIAVASYSLNTVYMLKKVKPATEKKVYRKEEMRLHIDSAVSHEVAVRATLEDKATTNTLEGKDSVEEI